MNRLGYILKSAREDNDLTQIQVMRLTGINNKRWDDAFEAIPFEKRSDTLNIVETMIKLMETVA